MATVAEELSKAMADVAARVAPSVVGVGAGREWRGRGSGARGDQRPQHPCATRSSSPSPTAGGPTVVPPASTWTATWPWWRWTPATPPPSACRRRATVRMGDAVLALANPGGRAVRVSVGFVSALDVAFRGPGGRRVRGAIEHTAPLARGSSGGPVVDVLGQPGRHRHPPRGRRLLPGPPRRRGRSQARVDALSHGDVPRRPRLGIAIAPPRVARRLRQSVGLPERDGLLVHAVEEGGAADRAGIRQGDLVVRVAATDVDHGRRARRRARGLGPRCRRSRSSWSGARTR